MNTQTPISQAVEIIGLSKLAKFCGVTYPAVRKWEKVGRLPRTEWTGETNYAEIIERETAGQVTRNQLLQRPAVVVTPPVLVAVDHDIAPRNVSSDATDI